MIRAALLDAWPALAEFGVTPLNFDRYSMVELQTFLDHLEERARIARAQLRKSRRR